MRSEEDLAGRRRVEEDTREKGEGRGGKGKGR